MKNYKLTDEQVEKLIYVLEERLDHLNWLSKEPSEPDDVKEEAIAESRDIETILKVFKGE